MPGYSYKMRSYTKILVEIAQEIGKGGGRKNGKEGPKLRGTYLL
jgi:hypothetical protein